MPLPENLLDLLHKPSPCFVSTIMADGSPQVTETWVDTDGEHVVINTVVGFVKVRNVERDPRVALAIQDPDNPFRYIQVRGEVISITTDGATKNIEALSLKYTGGPYPWYGGRDQQRVILTIKANSISGQG
jgi:PPOX class probable F420-dependent enzyme